MGGRVYARTHRTALPPAPALPSAPRPARTRAPPATACDAHTPQRPYSTTPIPHNVHGARHPRRQCPGGDARCLTPALREGAPGPRPTGAHNRTRPRQREHTSRGVSGQHADTKPMSHIRPTEPVPDARGARDRAAAPAGPVAPQPLVGERGERVAPAAMTRPQHTTPDGTPEDPGRPQQAR